MKNNYQKFWNVLTENKALHHVYEGIYLYEELGLLGFNDYQDLMKNTIEVLISTFDQGLVNGMIMMNDIINAADEVGVRLMVLPEYVWFNQEDFGTRELVKWLRKFGFKGTSERMFRMPTKNKSLIPIVQ